MAEICRIIPVKVDEHGKRDDSIALKVALRKLRAGQNIFIYPEAGREIPGPDGQFFIQPFAPGVVLLARNALTVSVITTEGMRNVQTYYKNPEDLPHRWFDWIGRRFVWKHWAEGRKQRVDITLAPPISQRDIQDVVGNSRSHARDRIITYLEQVMRAKTDYLIRIRGIRTKRETQRQ